MYNGWSRLGRDQNLISTPGHCPNLKWQFALFCIKVVGACFETECFKTPSYNSFGTMSFSSCFKTVIVSFNFRTSPFPLSSAGLEMVFSSMGHVHSEIRKLD